MELPTIKIKDGDDYIIINLSDFDPAAHVPFDAADDAVEPAPDKPRRGCPPKQKDAEE